MKELTITSSVLHAPAQEESFLFLTKAEKLTIHIEKGATLLIILAAMKGWAEAPLLEFFLEGEESEVLFLGFFVGKDTDQFSLATVARHKAPHTKASFYLRAIMNDVACMDYKGNLIIEKKAQGADAYLSHKTLLLSDKARAHTLPALEIEADDIKAGHNATIGKIDRDALFYALSRGIDEATATELFVKGFLEEQVQMIPDENLQTKIRHILLL